MKEVKRTLCILLALVMVLSLSPLSALAGEIDPEPVICTEHVYGEDGLCTVCGAEKPADPEPVICTEHVYGEDGLCTVCGAEKPTDPEPVICTEHVYGENGLCTVCGAEKPADPGEDADTDNLPNDSDLVAEGSDTELTASSRSSLSEEEEALLKDAVTEAYNRTYTTVMAVELSGVLNGTTSVRLAWDKLAVLHEDDAADFALFSVFDSVAEPLTFTVDETEDAIRFTLERSALLVLVRLGQALPEEEEIDLSEVPEIDRSKSVGAIRRGVFFASAAAPKSSSVRGADDGLNLNKFAEIQQDGTYKVTLEQYTTGTVVSGTLDVVLVLDRSSSLGSDGLTNVKTAAKNFVDQLAAQAAATNATVRLAVISFSADVANVQGTLTDVLTNAGAVKTAINGISNNAMTDILTRTDLAMTRAQEILTSQSSGSNTRAVVLFTDGEPVEVNYQFTVNGATSGSWSGLKYFSMYDLMNGTYPVTFASIHDLIADLNQGSTAPANRALATANAMKAAGIVIYTVGVFDGADGATDFVNDPNAVFNGPSSYEDQYSDGGYQYWEQYTNLNWSGSKGAVYYNNWVYDVTSHYIYRIKTSSTGNWQTVRDENPYHEVSDAWDNASFKPQLGNKFLHLLSSNYPSASSMSSYSYGEWNGGSGYYLSGGSTADLNALFATIASSLNPTVSLGAGAVVRDTIPSWFEMAPNTEVHVYTQDYNGSAFTGARTEITSQLTVSTQGQTVSVSGYDFNSNVVTPMPRPGTGDYGRKLIIEFTVRPTAYFLGGNAVPTNDSAGIYESGTSQTPLESYDVPEVNVPLAQLTVTAADKTVYLLGDVTQDDMLNGATVGIVNRYDSTQSQPVTLDANHQYDDGFATITLTPAAAQSDLTADGSFTLTAAAESNNPAATASAGGAPNKDPGPGAAAVNASATANILVLIPKFFFRDQYVWIGMPFADMQYDVYDYVTTAWMYGEYGYDPVNKIVLDPITGTEARDPETFELITIPTPLGTVPTPSFTYDPGAAAGTGYVNTSSDIPVKVTVTIDGTDVTGSCEFHHCSCYSGHCAWSNSSSGGDPAFLLHILSLDMTVNKKAKDSEFIYGISGASFEILRWNGTDYAPYSGNTFTAGTETVTLYTGDYKIVETTPPPNCAPLSAPIYLQVSPSQRSTFLFLDDFEMIRCLTGSTYMDTTVPVGPRGETGPYPRPTAGRSVSGAGLSPSQTPMAAGNPSGPTIRIYTPQFAEALMVDENWNPITTQSTDEASLNIVSQITHDYSYKVVDGVLVMVDVVRVSKTHTLDIYNETVFYVYHSSDHTVDTIPMSAVGANGFDLTSANTELGYPGVKSGYFYGGYYSDYLQKGNYAGDGAAPTQDMIDYRGGSGYWNISQAFTDEADDTTGEGGVGTAMHPLAGQTYYLKEVPNAFLTPYTHLIYRLNSTPLNKIAHMFLMTNVDDTNYNDIGLIAEGLNKDNRSKLALTYIITTQATVNGESVTKRTVITAKTISDVKTGYVAVWLDDTAIVEDGTVAYRPYYVTPDGITVESLTARTVYLKDTCVDASLNLREPGSHFYVVDTVQ